MPDKIDDLIPSARHQKQTASMRPKGRTICPPAAGERKKRALIDRLSKPSGLSETKGQASATVIQRAVRNG
jgi:hypothetical protein